MKNVVKHEKIFMKELVSQLLCLPLPSRMNIFVLRIEHFVKVCTKENNIKKL